MPYIGHLRPMNWFTGIAILLQRAYQCKSCPQCPHHRWLRFGGGWTYCITCSMLPTPSTRVHSSTGTVGTIRFRILNTWEWTAVWVWNYNTLSWVYIYRYSKWSSTRVSNVYSSRLLEERKYWKKTLVVKVRRCDCCQVGAWSCRSELSGMCLRFTACRLVLAVQLRQEFHSQNVSFCLF